MNPYITGSMIKRLRESKHMTQHQLAEKLNVSEKAVSKWETNRGYPDITLIEPLADALGISIIELFSGDNVENTNRSFNMLRMKLYVCPICGNVIESSGEAVVSCCGITLPQMEAEKEEEGHYLQVECVEDEYFVSCAHEMSKDHYISFIIAVRDDGYEMVKLYPEGNAEARFKRRRVKYFLYYCNKHGLFKRLAR